MRRLGCLLIGLMAASGASAQSTVQTFFVPNPATEVRTWAEAIQSLAENDEIHSVISITATTDDTVIYYDHWEDGFEADITSPTLATSEIWGDRDCSNGFTPLIASCTPGVDDANDVVFAGDVLVLEDDVPVPGGVRDPAQIFFDGRDKFATSELVTVTRAAWPSTGIEAQLGGAVEVFDTSKWGSEYEVPVGEGVLVAFEFVGLAILAEEDGTAVSIDLDADGTPDQALVLNEGETSLVGAVGATDVLAGATITASADLQLNLLTANENTNYEGRWYSQIPTSEWSNHYYSPVASTVAGDLVHLFIYNPGPADPIDVTVDELSGCRDFSIGAGAFVEVALAVNSPLSAAELSSDGTDCGGAAATSGNFFAIATVDRNETIHDWGYTLIPEESLTPSAVIGWAPGSTNLTENASPVWITPVGLTGGATTTVYVDYEGDGLGPLTVGGGGPCAGLQYDQEFAGAGNLASLRLFEPDNDQTGTRIFTCDGTRITAAWGQDPEFSGSGQPQQLDMGTTVLPFARLAAFKDGALFGDNNGNGGLDPGDTILYSIRVVNNGIISITDIDLIDTLDPNTTYVADTTEVDGSPIADDVSPDTPFPLDIDAGHPNGYPLVVSPQVLLPGGEILVTFVAAFTPLTETVLEIVNTVTVESDSETFVDSEASPVQQGELRVIKTSSAAGQYVEPGQVITYSVTVSNVADGTLTGITLTDPVPAGTMALSGTTEVTGPTQRYVLDLFDPPASYSNNDGPSSWEGDWTEAGDDGNPGTGNVQIAAGQLTLDDNPNSGGQPSVAREVDLADFAGGTAALRFAFEIGSGVDLGDAVTLEISTTGTGGPYTPLEVFTNIDTATVGNRIYDISSFISADTAVRFRVSTGYGGADEVFRVDNLSIRAVGAQLTATDDLSSGDYSGGSGWNGDWIEDDPDDPNSQDPTTGEVQVVGARLRLDNQDVGATLPAVSRAVDLSSCALALWKFDFETGSGVDTSDEVAVEVARDGVNFLTLETITGLAGTFNGSRTYDLSALASANTVIRYRLDFDYDGANEFFFADNVEVVCGQHTTVIKDNFGTSPIQLLDGDLPLVTLQGDEFALAVGETLTATFDVVADTPLAVSEITNVVTADAFEDVEPAMASVTDPADPSGGAIGDLVWLDLDGDGVHDIGEPGIPNVTVELRDGSCVPASTCPTLITDADGRYLFSGLSAGTYDVFVDETTLPAGLTISPGSVNPVTSITIISNEAFFDVDFPYTNVDPGTAIIGDRVWADVDADGIQDPGELGLAGVSLDLIGPGPDGVFGTGDETVEDTVTTGPDGTYLFIGVTPGEYIVDVTGGVPAGYNKTLGPQSLPDPTDPITVIAGEMITDVDFGYAAVCLSRIGFELDALGNPLTLGQAIDDEYAAWGLTISAQPNAPAPGPAMIFDSSTPTGTDYDLGSPNLTCSPPGPGDGAGGELGQPGENCTALGNVLIISEDGDALDPDDSGFGGTITFSFTHDVEVDSLDFLDIETAGYFVDFYDAGGGLIANVPVAALGDNSYQNTPVGLTGVREFVVNFDTSGSMDGINFCTGPSALYTVRDRVWLDLDGDGVQDLGEPGIANVTVSLYNASGEVIATAISDANGNVSFTNLPDGSYDIVITDTAGELVGLNGTTPPALVDMLSVVVSGGDVTGVNFGYNAAGLIGDRVWSDANGNGLQDAGEPGIAGVTLDLVGPGPDTVFGTADDVLISTTTTGADGSYQFVNRAPGAYQVAVTDTGGVLGTYSQTGDPSEPGGPCAVCDELGTTSLALGTSDLTLDFGYQDTNLSNVSGTVFLDLDRDGVEEAGETGFVGVTLDLVTAGTDGIFGTVDDVVVATTTSDANGDYMFEGLEDGDYQVQVTDVGLVLDGYFLTSGLDEYPITVAGADLTDIDFGYIRDEASASIGDAIWLDENGDGLQSAVEAGIPAVSLDLWLDDGDGVLDTSGATDTLVATTLTDADGEYLFPGLVPGSYFVDVDPATVPAGLVETIYPVGVDPSAMIALSEEEDYNEADFGYVPGGGNAVIGDRVWYDTDGDGLQDPGEIGIEGVTVVIYGPGCAPCTEVTGPDGIWLRTGLAPGDYGVQVDVATLPAGYNTTPTNLGGQDTHTVTLAADDLFTHLDFGFDGGTIGSIGSFIWFDDNGSGDVDAGEIGVEGVTINLIRDDNGNGAIDPGEPILATVRTDESGGYTFSGLPVSVAGVDYLIDVTDIDELLIATNKTTGTPDTDDNSQDDPYDVTLTTAAPDVVTADFGYAPSDGMGSIGSQVWHDRDLDGLFEPLGNDGLPGTADDESGLQGVTIQLWLDDGDSVYEPFTGDDNLLRSVTTDENGEYEFDALPPSTYWVTVTDLNGVLAGFAKTPIPGAPFGCPGADDTSKEDPCIVVLTAGASSDVTADFGYALDPASALSIRGTVFEDEDANGTFDEPPGGTEATIVPGATLFLFRDLDGDGALDPNEPQIGTTISDANGDYLFDSLPPGDYLIAVDPDGTFAEDFIQTTQTGSGGLEPVTLAAADVNDRDFGFWNGGRVLTPVTLAGFEATGGGTVTFRWTTATEVGNVGFHIHAVDGDRMVRLNDELIAAVGDSLEAQEYVFEAAGVAGDTFILEDRDLFGTSTFHGPFTLGEPRGRTRIERKSIDWRNVREGHAKRARARKAERAARAAEEIGGSIETTGEANSTSLSALSAGPSRGRGGGIGEGRGRDRGRKAVALLRVDRDSIYRVSYEELLAAGADFTGARLDQLGLESRGQAVPLRVVAPGGARGFGPGAYVEFVGEALDTLYTRTNVYRLKVAPGAPRVIEDASSTFGSNVPEYYMESLEVERQARYDFAAPGDDPWYEKRLLAVSGPVETTLPLELEGWVAGAAPVTLWVDMWGVTDFPTAPDHHVVIDVNESALADELFDGLVDHAVELEVPDAVLEPTANSLRLRLPHDTGADYDLVNYDGYEVTYPRHFRARNGALSFTAGGASAYRVDGLPSSDVVVYQVGDGWVGFSEGAAVSGVPGDYSVTFGALSDEPVTYYVAAVENLPAAAVEPAPRSRDILRHEADLVVISHADFLDGVDPLVRARRRQGLEVEVVDVAELYETFSHGIVDPEAIRRYLAHAHFKMGAEFALLVGGDTYDYFDYLGTGSMSFVPTPYARTGQIVHYAPVDSLYVDFDADGVVEMALGRLPVRTVEELDRVIAKTLDYETIGYGGTAVLAADGADLTTGYSFTEASEAMRSQLPAYWQSELAYMDELGIDAAREVLIGEMGAGVALTSYFGHSGPTVWSFDGLFDTGHAEALDNDGRPTVVAQWGCWNTYHVSPSYDTLSHVLMLAEDRGAAAVLGAATLTEAASERLLGTELYGRIGEPGMPIGRAVLEAKQALGAREPDRLDVLWGWTLLGDPTLIVQP